MAIAGENYGNLPRMSETISGDGYSVSSLDALGEGPGFRKIRGPLGVTAFGINAIVLSCRTVSAPSGSSSTTRTSPRIDANRS
jgi:hypothetical protein